MEGKKVPSSDTEKEVDNTTENGWVDLSELSLNLPSGDPTTACGDDDIFSTTNHSFKCKVCQVGFTGIEPYEQHINSSKHKKKVQKETMKQKYGPKYLAALQSQETGSEPVVETVDGTNDNDAEVIRCDVCNKICTGLVSYKLHITGKSHQKQLRKQNCIEKLQENSSLNEKEQEVQDTSVYNVMPHIKPFAQCDTCEKKFSGPEGYQDHLSSASHKRKLEMAKLTEKLTGESEMSASTKPQDFFARCQTCEKNFSGPVPYQQHLISEAHQKKLKKLDLVQEMKSLSAKDGQEDTFQCKDCGRYFQIPEEFKQHLNSTYHNRKKIRQQMIEKLQTEYPEVEVQTVASSHDDHYENQVQLQDDGIILICTICHKSFSGPETAISHFSSQKHARAKKQNLLLKQQRKVETKEIF